jgi:hypothetical protein
MQKIIDDLATPYWWVSVVLVGIAINLASAYMKGPLDRWIEKRSSRRAEQNGRLRREFELQVQRLVEHPGLLWVELMQDSKDRWSTVLHVVIATLAVLAGVEFIRESGDQILGFGASLLAIAELMIVFAYRQRISTRERVVRTYRDRLLLISSDPTSDTTPTGG